MSESVAQPGASGRGDPPAVDLSVTLDDGPQRRALLQDDRPTSILGDRDVVDPGAEHGDLSGGTLQVHVVDRTTGETLAGFRLRVVTDRQDLPAMILTTDASGTAISEPVLERGVLSFKHVLDLDSDRFDEPWEIVDTSVIVDFETTASARVEVRAGAPRVAVKVGVLRASGEPAVDCVVQLIEGVERESSPVWWRRWRVARTDATGHATFFLYSADAPQRAFVSSLREPFHGEVSDLIAIPTPIHAGPWTLQLYRGAELLVRVNSPEGPPQPGLNILVSPAEGARWRERVEGVTDAFGAARFQPLPAGVHSVRVYDQELPPRLLATETVELQRGLSSELNVVLSDVTAAPLVVSGVLLEPDGSPAVEGMLTVSCDGLENENVFVREDGSFEYRSNRACAIVTVTAAASVFADPVEPEQVHVPAGTSNLVFRKTSKTEETFVLFELTDAETRLPIADGLDAAVIVYRGPQEGQRITAHAFFGPDGGTTSVDFHPHPDLRWAVAVPGYQGQSGVLELSEPGSETPIYRVELHRGFRRNVVVRGGATGRRLTGVVVRDPTGERLGVTGSDGEALLLAGEWPGRLTFEAAGFETLTWNSSSHWRNFSSQIWMRSED